jgi:hypothetical protein
MGFGYFSRFNQLRAKNYRVCRRVFQRRSAETDKPSERLIESQIRTGSIEGVKDIFRFPKTGFERGRGLGISASGSDIPVPKQILPFQSAVKI